MTVFLRILDVAVDEKPARLLGAITAWNQPRKHNGAVGQAIFEKDPASFSSIPGSPFAYWASKQVIAIFDQAPMLEGCGRIARQGLSTADDFRFVRATWEVPSRRIKNQWFGFAKGGRSSRFYSDVHLVLNWSRDGRELKAWAGRLYDNSHWSRILKNVHLYGQPGLTWPRRTQSGLGMRAMPAGCIFADKGPAVFCEGNASVDLLSLLAITVSAPYRHLVELQMTFGSYEVGVIQRTPLPELDGSQRNALAMHARRAWSLKRLLDTVDETSNAFVLPLALSKRITGLDQKDIQHQLLRVRRDIDDLCFAAYGLGAEDNTEIGSSLGPELWNSAAANDEEATSDEDEDGARENPKASLLSWLVGVAFGRFDVRLISGERVIPPEPEPFDSMPTQPPGMWPANEERLAPPPDLLVDDPGHARDIGSHVSAGLALVDVPEPHNLRQWLTREFFPLHIKMYSRSRRKAPIYWQLATPSASYSVWFYIHAFGRDTLFRVQNDYVLPKLMLEERRLEAMEQEAGEAAAAQRKAIAEQEAFVAELRSFLDEVKRVAPLWDPDLNDGVIINFAPLWRLVPHHRPWQKELKATWNALCQGKYDWSHLAMRLWPGRVVPKCASDRSVAIAHGLEDVFWVQGANGEWTGRAAPSRPISEVIAERSSSAVQAALKSLLDAPAVGGRTGRRRSTASTTDTGGR